MKKMIVDEDGTGYTVEKAWSEDFVEIDTDTLTEQEILETIEAMKQCDFLSDVDEY